MTPKSKLLIDSIFNKLKKYKWKKIILEKENFKKFIYSLIEES